MEPKTWKWKTDSSYLLLRATQHVRCAVAKYAHKYMGEIVQQWIGVIM